MCVQMLRRVWFVRRGLYNIFGAGSDCLPVVRSSIDSDCISFAKSMWAFDIVVIQRHDFPILAGKPSKANAFRIISGVSGF